MTKSIEVIALESKIKILEQKIAIAHAALSVAHVPFEEMGAEFIRKKRAADWSQINTALILISSAIERLKS